MNLSRTRIGELIAAAGGVALFVSLFLPWRGVSDDYVEAAAGLGVELDLPTQNAWEAFTFLDLALVVPVLVALGLGALALASRSHTPRAAAAATGLVAAVAALAVGYRIARPLGGDEVEYGMWIALASSLAIVAGAALAMRAEGERGAAATPRSS